MISYSFSIQGKSHIDHGTVCQDYSKVIKLSGGWMLGMVADGVGSALLSDVGSKMAVELLGDFCTKKISAKMTNQELESLLCQGYKYAMNGITQYAEKEEQPLEHFDTTLSAALYNGEKVIYGHSGDGGILVRLNSGKTIPVTERQKGSDGSSVIPLRAGETFWTFGTCNEKTAAVLLATDGMLDGVFQPVLVNLPSDLTVLAKGNFSKKNVYVTATEFFMNPDCVYQNRRIKDANQFIKKYIIGNLEKETQVYFWNCIQNAYIRLLGKDQTEELEKGITKFYYAVWALKNVTDDKSVVCLINEKAKVKAQNVEYYREPNWKWRQDSYNALLYGKPMPPAPEDYSIKSVIETKEIDKKKGGGSGKKNRIVSEKKDEHHVKIRKTGYGYIIGSIIAVLLVAGLGIGTAMFLLGGEEGEEEMQARNVHSTQMPTITPHATKDPQMKKEELGEDERSFLEGNSKKFVNVLKSVDVSRYKQEKIANLRNGLECHGLDKELEKKLGEIEDEPSSVASGSAVRQSTGNVPDQKLNELLEYTYLINTEEEKEVFVEGFINTYRKLPEDERSRLCQNFVCLVGQ